MNHFNLTEQVFPITNLDLKQGVINVADALSSSSGQKGTGSKLCIFIMNNVSLEFTNSRYLSRVTALERQYRRQML